MHNETNEMHEHSIAPNDDGLLRYLYCLLFLNLSSFLLLLLLDLCSFMIPSKPTMHLLLFINIFLLIWHRLLHSYLNCSLFMEDIEATIYKIRFILFPSFHLSAYDFLFYMLYISQLVFFFFLIRQFLHNL